LPTYLKAGFTVYDEKVIDQMIPKDMTFNHIKRKASHG